MQLLGQVCRVFRILPRGDIYVTGRGAAWIFNPQLLSHYDELASLPWPNPLLPSSQKGTPEGNLERIQGYLEINPAQVCLLLSMFVIGRTVSFNTSWH